MKKTILNNADEINRLHKEFVDKVKNITSDEPEGIHFASTIGFHRLKTSHPFFKKHKPWLVTDFISSGTGSIHAYSVKIPKNKIEKYRS